MSSIASHSYVKTKCGGSHKLRLFTDLKEFFTMKFVYGGGSSDSVGFRHSGNCDFLTPNSH
ncbi:hypothetical protein BWD12_17545 [Leptospira santarosai serovar Bananal]|nr:hypothetical protein BWD11_01775 [Leptospira santarosai serovar Grippotyphosa]ONF76870.1 hypothetical protein BWD12_17545 [Leptospira santarosai serovar Bananal]ONF83938.1 hypothetical protein BWD13_17380 [Leptospira santarosai serovar Grippotyphosa]